MKIRILVVVQSNGKWSCAGWSGAKDEDLRETLTEFLDSCDSEVFHYVEVDVPLPEPPLTFQGQVVSSSGPEVEG